MAASQDSASNLGDGECAPSPTGTGLSELVASYDGAAIAAPLHDSAMAAAAAHDSAVVTAALCDRAVAETALHESAVVKVPLQQRQLTVSINNFIAKSPTTATFNSQR